MEASKKKIFLGNIIVTVMGIIFLVMIISLIGNALGWQATYTRINAVTGNIEKSAIAVINLFNDTELRNIIGNAMANFVTFTPLGSFLISLIGVGMAYKSGLLAVIFTIIGRHFSKFWLTFMFALIGILSNSMGDTGYVILIPLAAIFYLVNNRNPLAGMLATFVSISAGQGINFLLSNLEYGLAPYTELTAKLTDDSFILKPHHNIFFCIVAVIALAFLITYITEKIIIPRIPKYRRDEDMIEDIIIGRREKRGLVLATIGFTIILIVFIYMLIPGLPSSGLLLDSAGKTYADMLFGSDSYFSTSIVYLISLVLLITGWLYGLGAKTIKNKEQFSKMIYESFDNIGGMIVLIFFISQLIAIFKRSNIGTVITTNLIELIQTLNFSSAPLILLVFIFISIANLFLTSSITKWTIASPIIVPAFMNANMSAEFAQAVFRISEGATNILTPLTAYFVIFVGYLEIYNKGENRISFRDCYRMLWPYSLAIALLWLFILVTWYIIGLPIGFGVYPTV